MTSRKGQPSGQGYNFGGAKAQKILTRMKQLKAERERTGKDSAFGKPTKGKE